ncbi:M13 family metallopeptidase [Nannocystis punicea]|uniref:M13 family metallopeptidase n=1 Tax=Nannocystis punicea TaxID=2995304 RepID=A0ABY7GXK9_9BACT|nr:M13 family metallopeptidase [Nannocystis poenicansa]WAS91652.1 M13 family metallopeptidase [Nannocystis poenicansa]
MNQRSFAVILAVLAACGSSEPPPAKTAAVAPTGPKTPVLDKKPEFGAWGVDLAGMDGAVAPGASFYHHVNGHWLRTAKIPDDKSNYGLFPALIDRSQERTRQIIESSEGAPGTEGQKIGDYYKTFMDEAAIEALGTAPLQKKLESIAAAEDVDGIVALLAAHSRELGSTPFTTFVDQDDREPETHIATLSQGGLGLPDRDMYDASAGQFAPLRDGYKQYIATMFGLVGMPEAEARAAAVYALEEKLAASHWTRVQNRDPQQTYNKLTIAQLEETAPGIDWKLWLAGVGLAGQAAINVKQPGAIAAAARLVQDQPIAVWKDYLTLRVLTAAAPYLPKKFVDAHFEMFGKTLSGTPQLEARWKRGVDNVVGSLGDAVGKVYVAKYFPPETKAAADELVKNLLVAMGQRLDGLTWMSPATLTKAKEKLATYNPKIGYPKQWRDYSALTIIPGDALGNEERVLKFMYDWALAKLGKPVDRDEWNMPPMQVNAYYSAALNEIVFPAAILQPPFFDAAADPAVNYGGIGAVIGHEISHGFDDQGAQYDARGALKNWWSAEDAAKFKQATAMLVAQYNDYCPLPAADGKPAQCVNGELTLGENIADLAGLTIAFHAYQLSLGGEPAPVIDGLSGEQRFFLGWAQSWRRVYRDPELANRLVTDPHSPSEFRTDVVRNLDAWYDAFQPKAGEALYLAPDERVKIW